MAEEKPEIVYIPISTDTRNMLNEMRRGRDTYNSVIRRLIKETGKGGVEELRRAMMAAASDNPDAAEWIADVDRVLEFWKEEELKETKKK